MKPLAACVVVALAVSALAGCKKKEDTQPPVATATFSSSRAKAPLGSPLDLTYRFVVAANAPAFDKEYRVLVHFLDSDDQLMWTDDHFPPTSTKEWKPGQRIEYSRTMFVPQYPYMGQATIRIGLYDPETGVRLPLGGENDGQRAYKAGTLELLPASDNVFIQFKDGWHNAEVAAENAQVEWQWTKKVATLALAQPAPRRHVLPAFRRPSRPRAGPDGHRPHRRPGPRHAPTLTTNEEVIRRVPMTATQFGDAENVDLTIEVNQAFVPAQTPAAKSTDPRELGIRVFHAFIEPK